MYLSLISSHLTLPDIFMFMFFARLLNCHLLEDKKYCLTQICTSHSTWYMLVLKNLVDKCRNKRINFCI